MISDPLCAILCFAPASAIASISAVVRNVRHAPTLNYFNSL
jgi:hypothetical protein